MNGKPDAISRKRILTMRSKHSSTLLWQRVFFNLILKQTNILRDTVTHLDISNLAFEKRGKLEKDAQIMIKMLQKQEDQIAKLKILNAKNKKEAIAKYGLSNSVKFDYNPNEGRFARAKNDIKIGEEILVENPHCVMLLEKFSKSHCQNCFKR